MSGIDSRRLAASEKTDTDTLVLQYGAIALLVCFSALFSGLTLGLLGLDKIGLQIAVSGDDKDLAKKAEKISVIREDGNLLLCTLLLGNVAVNAALSILMADLTDGLVGFIASTSIIVIFGEIIPQAACSRYALHIGAFFVPVVKVLLLCLYPIAKPLAFGLDYWLGAEIGTIHTRKELSELLRIHVQHGAMDIEQGNVAQGAIEYQDKLVKSVMTPKKACYMVSADDILSFRKITEIFKSGYSRIPVYERDRNDIIGLLLVKDLIFVDPEDKTSVRNFIQIFGRSFLMVWPDGTLADTMRLFKSGNSHIAIVRDVEEQAVGDPQYVVAGVITLEDILEEIIGDEIVDETDIFLDEGAGTRVQRVEFDYDRLRLLDSGRLEYEQVTEKEAAAIGSYLCQNVKELQRGPNPFTEEHARCLLAGCPVFDLHRKGQSSEPAAADILYQHGQPADSMYVVLTGRATVFAGRNCFRAEMGPWSVLGAEALIVPEGGPPFIPDFSAHISTEGLRCIKVSRSNYLRALGGHMVWLEDEHGRTLSNDESLRSKGAIFKNSNAQQFETSRVATFAIEMPRISSTKGSGTLSFDDAEAEAGNESGVSGTPVIIADDTAASSAEDNFFHPEAI